MAKKTELEAALRKIIEQDDEDASVSDLQQHDRHAGFGAGVRAMANLAREALGRQTLPQTY